LARAAGSTRPRGTTLALVLASNLPDIDFVLWARSDASYLLFHRGFTHSLLGLAVLPPILALALWWGLDRRTSLRWWLLLCWAGTSLHVLYDLLTSWGTMLLYPFSVARLALDWIFIVDLVTWVLPCLVVLVAWRRPERSRTAAALFLAVFAVYAALAGLAHGAVRDAVAEAERGGGRPVAESYAVPLFGAPWRWQGITVAPQSAPEPRIARYRVSGIPPRPDPPERIERGFDNPWVRRSLATLPGQAYLWWAAVPVAHVESSADTVAVTLSDLRFHRTIVPTTESSAPFSLRFVFDPATGALRDVAW
jgi:inner membrane protein